MNRVKKILSRSLLLDLETTPDGKLLKVGAVCGTQQRFLKGGFSKPDAIQALDDLGRNADYVLGHNILDHDLPLLKKSLPALHLHTLPVIDTLFLSPVAFPENPYHRLVKDYRLLSTALNDPVCDARNAGLLFQDQCDAMQVIELSDKGLVQFYAWAFCKTMPALFQALDIKPFTVQEAQNYFVSRVADLGCHSAAQCLAVEIEHLEAQESTAYVLAWLRVAGSNSILPPWVRHRFPEVTTIIRRLRDKGCNDPACIYCQINHNPHKQLQRFFGFDDFRPEPSTVDGASLQEAIIRSGMNGEPLLAILPTGGGKSLCFQLPALVRNLRLGVLSIVISPLQALMKDQVDNLNRLTESHFAAALYGMLTPPERGGVLERIRLGDVAILYVSPEQLRNASFRKVIKQREIGSWIFDEAHCLSRWGHSFRPDYLYVSRFIREIAGQQEVPPPPVACFTATAKRDVVEEIQQHFHQELSQKLMLFDGGAERTNLDFEVQVVNSADKRSRVKQLLMERLPNPEDGASVVYCATRSGAEDMAKWLQHSGMSAEAFHAGVDAPEKRRIQEEFVTGNIQHICATNAFGMGIDKENVRLVIHADIPGSLENYLQEAGRAGRDKSLALCVLLYDKQDIETQFSLSAFSRLTRHDIAQILRGLRRAKHDDNSAVVITSGEILRDEEVDTAFNSTDPMATTKVNTAVSMLERGNFVRRDENKTNILQVQPLVRSMDEAIEMIDKLDLSHRVRRQWLEILAAIFNSSPDEGLSADTLAELPSMKVREESATSRTLQHDTLPVMRILGDMVEARVVEKDTLLSAYVKIRCNNSSDKVLAEVCALENAMIAMMREEEPDAEGWMILTLRHLNQRLLDDGFSTAPESLRSLLRSLSLDGQGLAGNRGSIELRYQDKNHYRVKLQREWDDLQKTAEKRQAVAKIVLETIARKIPTASSGEHQVKFSESELLDALHADLFIAAQIKDSCAVIERALLFLHEQKAIILQQGLAVFRSAMTITILPGAKGRRFTNGDYSSLKEHYLERNFQIHVMNKYADLGLQKIKSALTLVAAYFTMSKTEFVKMFFAEEQDMLDRATSAESYQEIVDQLNNGVQIAVVSARPHSNMLVLAGPGSGKTRVIAHRCAYLLRVERVRANEILIVCFNRAAAISLRQRIRNLAGKDAMRVTVQTYHGLAMRLIGASFSAHLDDKGKLLDLESMIPTATRMLKGECDIPGVERDEMRERLLAGYRHILIDEYQDIDQPQYDMISAIAGRALDVKNADAKLSILAVGDDDQNVYTFRGANIRFIRQFEQDYDACTHYMVENYRSTANIISAANQLIEFNSDRMKTGHPIQTNAARHDEPAGNPVRIMICPDALQQARFVLNAVNACRNAGGSIAVFSRTKSELHSIRAALESASIPSVMASHGRGNTPLHRMREINALIELVRQLQQSTVTATLLQKEFHALACYAEDNPWCRLTDAILHEWEDETNNNEMTPFEALDYLYEALHERQREHLSADEIYLSTVHAAKGLEFDHVIILGVWAKQREVIQQEEERRLYYVGMTRARTTLTLCQLDTVDNPHTQALSGRGIVRSSADLLDEPSDQELRQQYAILDLTSIWISYAATAPNARFVQQEIARLKHGSIVQLQRGDNSNRVFITDKEGHKIGALSNAASLEWKKRLPLIKEVCIHAIINWRREFLDQTPADDCPEEWEVPLLEVVLRDTGFF